MKDLPRDDASTNLLLGMYFLFKALPILISGIAIYLGYRLFILGVTGEASIVINAKGVEGQLVNAAPGVVFGLGGIAALIVSVWKGVHVNLGHSQVDPDGQVNEQTMAVNRKVDHDT